MTAKRQGHVLCGTILRRMQTRKKKVYSFQIGLTTNQSTDTITNQLVESKNLSGVIDRNVSEGSEQEQK